MGAKKAKAMSRDAFVKVFVEAEVLMRRNLAARIDELISKEKNSDIIIGLEKAKEIIIGVKSES
jgi:hypothetical protein